MNGELRHDDVYATARASSKANKAIALIHAPREIVPSAASIGGTLCSFVPLVVLCRPFT